METSTGKGRRPKTHFKCGRPRTEEFARWEKGGKGRKPVLHCKHCRRLQAVRSILEHWDEWQSDMTEYTKADLEKTLRELEAPYVEDD